MLSISHCESLNHSKSHIDGWVGSKTNQMKFKCGHATRLDDLMNYFLALWMNLCVRFIRNLCVTPMCYLFSKGKKKNVFLLIDISSSCCPHLSIVFTNLFKVLFTQFCKT